MREQGDSKLRAAIVLVAVGLVTWLLVKSDSHQNLAEIAFESFQNDNFAPFGDKMIEVWDEELEEGSWHAYYVTQAEFAGGWDGLRAKFKGQARDAFKKARAKAAKDFNWRDAEFEESIINKRGSRTARLTGFRVSVNGKTYRFDFTNPDHGLNYPLYKGRE